MWYGEKYIYIYSLHQISMCMKQTQALLFFIFININNFNISPSNNLNPTLLDTFISQLFNSNLHEQNIAFKMSISPH